VFRRFEIMFIINWFLTWWLRSARYRWSKLRRCLFESKYQKTELPEVNSLDDIEASLKKIDYKIDWILELFDSISYPGRVWEKQEDDCDGFAILAAELLRRWSPETEPVLITAMVRPYSRCHTVCAFTHGGNLQYFNNSRRQTGNFAGYQDIMKHFTSRAQEVICWDVVNPDTLKAKEFHVG
jgi:hypothetical protein